MIRPQMLGIASAFLLSCARPAAQQDPAPVRAPSTAPPSPKAVSTDTGCNLPYLPLEVTSTAPPPYFDGPLPMEDHPLFERSQGPNAEVPRSYLKSSLCKGDPSVTRRLWDALEATSGEKSNFAVWNYLRLIDKCDSACSLAADVLEHRASQQAQDEAWEILVRCQDNRTEQLFLARLPENGSLFDWYRRLPKDRRTWHSALEKRLLELTALAEEASLPQKSKPSDEPSWVRERPFYTLENAATALASSDAPEYVKLLRRVYHQARSPRVKMALARGFSESRDSGLHGIFLGTFCKNQNGWPCPRPPEHAALPKQRPVAPAAPAAAEPGSMANPSADSPARPRPTPDERLKECLTLTSQYRRDACVDALADDWPSARASVQRLGALPEDTPSLRVLAEFETPEAWGRYLEGLGLSVSQKGAISASIGTALQNSAFVSTSQPRSWEEVEHILYLVQDQPGSFLADFRIDSPLRLRSDGITSAQWMVYGNGHAYSATQEMVADMLLAHFPGKFDNIKDIDLVQWGLAAYLNSVARAVGADKRYLMVPWLGSSAMLQGSTVAMCEVVRRGFVRTAPPDAGD